MATPPSIEQVSIWILEVLEEERQREPDWLKCRVASEVLGALKPKHGLDGARINHGLNFCAEKRYVKFLNRQDGQVAALDDAGVIMIGLLQKSRLDDQEKKNWSRADKIALASLLLSIVSFVAGFHLGEQAATKSDNKPIPPLQTVTNTAASPKLP
jgi:hypothetical protein